MQIENGELRVSSNKQVLLSQYLQAALLYSIRVNELNLNREIELQIEESRAELELLLQYQIIDNIMGTPFSMDFDPGAFKITLVGDTLATARVELEYGTQGESISEQINITGGVINVDESQESPYEIEYTLKMIVEEVLLDEDTNLVSVALNPDGFAIMASTEVEPIVDEITVDTSTIPSEERHLITINADPDLITVESSNINGDDIELGYMSNLDDNAISEIFFRDLIQNNDPNMFPINIEDLANNVYAIQFIEEANDYLIQFSSLHPVANIKYTIIDSVAEGIDVINNDIYQRSGESTSPFPTDALRGHRYIQFNHDIPSGIYNVYYMARLTNDASMETI